MRAEVGKWAVSLARAGLVACLGWTAAAQAMSLPRRQVIAITRVTVIDVERGRSSGPRTVLVDDGRIVSIMASRHAHVPASARRVDGRGKFLIPGLVDMHVHLFNLSSHRPPNDWSFPLYVANGVTGVREMRGDVASMPWVRRWRKALDAGALAAPRILAAGIAVYGSSPDDAAHRVDAAADAGADFIKVFSELPASHWHAILAAAQARSLPVVGHVPAGVPLLVAAAAGQRSNEHLMQAYEACSSIETPLLEARGGLAGDALTARRDAQEAQALGAFDPGTCRNVARSLAAAGQAQVPTLVLADEDSLAQGRSPGTDPRWRFLRADERSRWERFLAVYTAADAALAKQRWPIARRIVSLMHEAGVPIMAGTDSPMPGVYPGFALHEEMELLVASGLTPREALYSATLGPAQFLGIADTSGSVAVGKRADLVLLDADPTRDIHNARRIDAVLLDGRLLRRADLDALLDAAARAQAR
ncbi:amidohydrolase family protein [Rhodanobacter ginsengisoli]|uniref:Amidohydrolase family protein n=1 Tax=Rhodanobacter ginsengisoli TaxID=418646 RepID=A0ABW0QP38_9GAMM